MDKQVRISYIKYILYSFFFLPYLGTSLPAYILLVFYLLMVVLIRPSSIKLQPHDLIIFSFLALWFVLKLLQSPPGVSLVLLRYYFGFYFFYFVFRQVKVSLDLERLLFAISLCVIVEAVLINTIISPSALPNYPTTFTSGVETYQTKILGFYQRPYSIGNNASITATLIMILLFYIRSMKIRYNYQIRRSTLVAAYMAVIMAASGEGFVLFILYNIFLLNPFKNNWRRLLSILALVLVYIAFFVMDFGAIEGFERMSKGYFNFLYEFKMGQIADNITQLKEENGFLIGAHFNDVSELLVFSDFAWNDLFLCAGIMGILLVICILFLKMNRYNIVALLIFIIGAFHYGAMFSLPGQLLMGYFLILSNEKIVDERPIADLAQT